MQVFVVDLVPYSANLDHLKSDGRLPKLTRKYFDPQVVVDTYAQHLDAWVELERMGFDGVGVNEHHSTPYGLMNSPNLMVASIAQRTKKLKILIYGNLLPLHEPLRLAEEISMLDCLSNGRIIPGAARGAPREYFIYNIPPGESRARFEECYEIMKRAWTEETFSYEGRFHRYKDVSIWPRPVQQPHPPVWVPVTGSRETLEWAAANNIPITPGISRGTMREDSIRHYAKCMAKAGRKVTPDHINVSIDCYVADSKARAVEEYAQYYMYFFNTLIQYDHIKQAELTQGYTSAQAHSHLRAGAKGTNADESLFFFGGWTKERFREAAEHMAVGTPDEVAAKIIEEAEEAGAGTVLLSCNRGALPQEMFLNQIRRLGQEVLPRLHAHKISRVKFAEDVVVEA
jgi:alkanesulfonate monooxygenase SsuD/methylene tetrahydromethanopterin reductase-like flavin-dependent oxidoreductase (luciferase family)